MLCLSRKTDYALIALAFLSERPGQTASAREIADAHGLPTATLMKLLKSLHKHGVLTSARGVNGGYRLGINPDDLSLYDLIEFVDGKVKTASFTAGAGPHHKHVPTHWRKAASATAVPPLVALRNRVVRFLKEVRVADLVLPGRRIEVPVESLGVYRIDSKRKTTASVPVMASA